MLGRTLHLALYPGRHCSGGHAGPGVPAGPGVRRNPPPPGRNCRTGYVAGGGTGPASAGSIQPGPSPGRAEIAFTMIIGASAGGHGDAGYRGSGRGRRRAGWWPRAGPSGFRGCWAGPARGCGCLLPGRWPGRPLAAAVPGRSWCPCRTRRTRWPWSSPRSATSAPVASKIRKPTSPSVAIRAKSYGFGASRAAVSRASNGRWVNPGVGGLGGHRGTAYMLGGRVLYDAAGAQRLINDGYLPPPGEPSRQN
jgi:hypothetical protein